MFTLTSIRGVILTLILLVIVLGHSSIAGASSQSAYHIFKRTTGQPPLSVKVQGNQLVNGKGQVIHLVGLNRSGTEYMCLSGGGIFDGPSTTASIAVMKSWHINAVRVPLNEDCWLSINGAPSQDSGRAYRAAIEAYVARLNSAGLYVILDVHWSAQGSQLSTGQDHMLDASHGPKLWTSIANSFKGN